MAVMNRIDKDRDGYITQTELYQALDLKPVHNSYQGPQTSVDQVLLKIRQGADKYRSLNEYVDVLFKMVVGGGSAYMSFTELNNCLKSFNFNLHQAEKIALMNRINANGDN